MTSIIAAMHDSLLLIESSRTSNLLVVQYLEDRGWHRSEKALDIGWSCEAFYESAPFTAAAHDHYETSFDCGGRSDGHDGSNRIEPIRYPRSASLTSY
jgi:hypothetical protein